MNNQHAIDESVEIQRISENTFYIQFRVDELNSSNITKIASVRRQLIARFGSAIVDAIPSYSTLLITIDINRIDAKRFSEEFLTTVQLSNNEQVNSPALIEIPVFYDAEVGYDLIEIAQRSGISPEEVIERHCNQTYTVYALGFAPGFAYLGHVDKTIATPRQSTPRMSVAKGSVGIADRQTGIYPSTSPGGWNIIGRTPIPLIDMSKPAEDICPITVGGLVKFISICRQEFVDLGGIFR